MSCRKSIAFKTMVTLTLTIVLLLNIFAFNLILANEKRPTTSPPSPSATTTTIPKAVPQAAVNRMKSSKHHTNSESSKNSSSSSNESSEDVKIVRQIPLAPKDFVSTTLSPEDEKLNEEIKRAATTTTIKPKSTTIAAAAATTTARSAGEKTNKLKDSKVSKMKESKTLLEPTSICGRVPLFEKLYKQSINETFSVKTGDSDDSSGGEFRILHGLNAVPGEWPWIVKINFCEKGKKFCPSCTGSLINSRWVITAGHCAIGEAQYYKGIFGKYDLLINETSVLEAKFDKVIRHPNFTTDFENDLTLFRLSHPVAYNDFIQPVCILDERHSDSVAYTKQRRCYNVGYGETETKSVALKLQKLEVEARKPEECNNQDVISLKLVNNSLCIGPRGDHMGASCRGDSGGPNACYDPHTNQWFLFSTVSYGPMECDREDGDKWLSVSVDLVRHLKWIKKTIQDNSN